MVEFAYQDMLPLGADDTPYRLLTSDFVTPVEAGGRRFLEVDPEALTLLTRQAMHDIAHLLRPGHLTQLRAILDDPEASPNDRFVALELLKNACIAAGGVLPSCQDTGTAIVKGKKGELVLTGGGDEEAIARGIFRDLRRRQPALLADSRRSTCTPRRTPAPTCRPRSRSRPSTGDAYKLLFMAKGGGSANKSLPVPGDQGAAQPRQPHALARREAAHARHGRVPAVPPRARDRRHVGRVRAEDGEARVARATSTRCRATGNELGRGFRDVELEQQVLQLTQAFGIGAQFGGKYFCHDVRVIRLPRHGASCPVALAVSCSADRQALGKITADGVFLEQLETDPAKYLPDVTEDELEGAPAVAIDLNRPMDEIRAHARRSTPCAPASC